MKNIDFTNYDAFWAEIYEREDAFWKEYLEDLEADYWCSINFGYWY